MNGSERPLLICGTRSFALEVADVARFAGYVVAGFVENWDRERVGPLADLPVHWVDELPSLADSHCAVCALATTRRSLFTAQVEAHGIPFATLVHPTAHVSTTTSLGAGTIVGPGAMVGAETSIGRHVLLNRGVLVGHHTQIGDHVSLLPGANVAGNCRIGSAVFIGMGALILDNVEVGPEAVVGAGAVVTRDVPAATQVMGVPARVVEGRRGPR